MNLAKDGLPYDIDYIGDTLRPTEVEVIQDLRPHGLRRRMAVDVGKEVAELAKDQIISCKVENGIAAFYSRFIADPPEIETVDFGKNGPGENNPKDVIIRLIKTKASERKNVRRKKK